MNQEKYNIFLDSPVGLMAGSLDLCQTHTGVTGHVTLMDHGTNITEGKMDGDNRDF